MKILSIDHWPVYVGQNTVLAGIFFLTFLAVCECVTEHTDISRAGISGGIFCGSDYTHYDYFWIGETDYDYFWQRVILSCGHGVHKTYFLWIKSGDFTELLRWFENSAVLLLNLFFGNSSGKIKTYFSSLSHLDII